MDLINDPAISNVMFFPRRANPVDRFDIEVPGATLACALTTVENSDGWTVVHFHGNGEVVADWQGTLDDEINALGWNMLLAEYRGYGASTGSPILGDVLDDVSAVIEAAGSPEKIVLFGRSIGSLFALEAVTKFPNIAGVIIESGLADAVELFLDSRRMGIPEDELAPLRQRLDHREKIGNYTGPVLILHTQNDGLVNVSHAKRLAEWAGGEVDLRIFERGNHGTIWWVNNHEYLDAVADFLAKIKGELIRSGTAN